MKKNANELIRDDILKVCVDYFNHANQKSLNYICVNQTPTNNQTISCDRQLTPYKMYDIGLLSIVESFNDLKNQSKLESIVFRANTMTLPILLRVTFNKKEIIRYLSIYASPSIKNHIKQVGKYEIWRNTFRFHNHKLYLPPYLNLTFSTKNIVNLREKLVELAASGKQEGHSYSVIKNKLSQLCGHLITDKTLSAMITSLNKKRFSRAKGAQITLMTFTKEDEKKYIRIQVLPTTHIIQK